VGEITVSINDKQWVCSIASSPIEIIQGLGGVESIEPWTGMLFDLGVDYSRIDINMGEMLFPLDIIFINSNLRVVGVLHDVQPNEEAYFIASNSLGARYFMEVNAGEAASVEVGDVVSMQGDMQTVNIGGIIGYLLPIMVVTFGATAVIKAMGPSKPKWM